MFKELIGQATDFLSDHSAEILTGIGIGCSVFAVALTADATIKAVKILEEEGENRDEPFTVKEAVKRTWKCYIPPALVLATSVGCVLGAHTIHAKNTAAWVAAYTATANNFQEYKTKAKELLGEEKEKELQKAADVSTSENSVSVLKEVKILDHDEVLIYDPICNFKFTETPGRLRSAASELARQLTYEDSIAYSEFYSSLDYKPPKISNSIGWANKRNDKIDIEFIPTKDKYDYPFLTIHWYSKPERGFETAY